MKKLLIPICAGLCIMLGTTLSSKAQSTAKGLIISTSTQSEVDKVLETLKKEDPSTYRLTVTSNNNGKLSSKVYGTAPIAAIDKVGGAKLGAAKGGITASDVVFVVKVITSGKELQNSVISKLNTKLTKQSVQSVKLNAMKGNNM